MFLPQGGFVVEPPKKRQRITRSKSTNTTTEPPDVKPAPKSRAKGKGVTKGKGKTIIQDTKENDLSTPLTVTETPSSEDDLFQDAREISTQPTSYDDEPGPSTKPTSRRKSRRSAAPIIYKDSDFDDSDDPNFSDDGEYVDLAEEDEQEDKKEIKVSTQEIEKLVKDKAVPARQRASTTPKPRAPRGSKPKAPKGPKLTYHERATKALYKYHPDLETVFTDLEAKGDPKPEKAEPNDMTIELLPFQKEGLDWLVKQEEGPYNGGILADEMGMGKTIQTIALFMADKKRDGPILVVAPTVAIMQWKSEIESHTGSRLLVGVFHGQNRATKVKELKKFDVILTTYALISSVYRKQTSGFRRKNGLVKEDSLLHKIEFHRIVLDEAHNIKDRNSITSRAVYNLKGKFRLCLSGTPLQNRVGEIYSLLRFLQIKPFCENFCRVCECRSTVWKFNKNYCEECGHSYLQHTNFFNHSMLKHLQKGSGPEGQMAMKNMRILLSQIMLRRTKVERSDDLGLPPRVVEIRRDFFNEEEVDVYSSIYSDSMRQFSTYVAQGVVLNNYANIFSLITRMRQMADHPDLVLRRHADHVDDQSNTLVCQLCDDEAEEAIRSRCHHTFCRLCIKEYCEGWVGAEEDLECPVCHVALTIDLTAPALQMDTAVVKKSSILSRIKMDGNWRSSTKIEALVEELYKLRSDKQTIKSIVFSQFTSMLDLVEWRLNRAGFQTVKLQGSMSPTQRQGIIKHFMETPSVEIFLVSLKAGGVALNLCEASQVFILDPWWNPSVEWQSGDRVHRIGQHRPVKITRLVIEDSIESRIVELQEKKASMIQATIGNDDAAMNRLTPADMQFLFVNH